MKAKKRGYHHGDLRRVLLDASVTIIGEGGTDALSLRDVARRAGVSPAAPYHHFASKTALLAAISSDGFVQLAAAMSLARDAEREGLPMARLRAIGEAYVRFAIEHPAHFHLMFRGPALPPDASPAGLPVNAFDILLHAVQEVLLVPGIASTTTRPALVALSWAVVHGAAALVLDGPLAQGLPGMAVEAREIPALVTRTLESLLVASARPPVSEARPRKA